MKKRIVLFLFLLTPVTLRAFDDPDFDRSPWRWNARINGTVSNVSFRNWTAGGVDYSYVAGLSSQIEPSFSDSIWSFDGSWDGRLSTFGGRGQAPRKTEDNLEVNLKGGRLLWHDDSTSAHLALVVFTDLQTQFMPDYNLFGDPDGRSYTANFMAPGYITDGVGVDFLSDSLNLSIVLTPFAAKQTLVLDRGVDQTYYGVAPHKRIDNSPGAYSRITWSDEILPRTVVSVKTILFTDYSEKFSVDVSFFGEVDYNITSFVKIFASLHLLNDNDIRVRIYEDLDGDGKSDDFAGVSRRLQLYGQLGVGVNIRF